MVYFRFHGKKDKLQKAAAVWKFLDYSAAQILREINFGEPRISKTTIFANFVALNVVHLEIFSLEKLQIFIKIKIQSL